MSNHDEHSVPPDTWDAQFIVELGCHRGEVTERLAEMFPVADILAVEMNPESASEARERLRPYYPRVTVLTFAVGYPGRLTTAHLSGGQQDRLDAGDFEMWVLTLDQILENEAYERRRIDFLKMDVEGAEYEILLGGGRWPRVTDTMLIERHREDPIEKIIEALGFKTRPRLDDPTWGNHHWCWKERP